MNPSPVRTLSQIRFPTHRTTPVGLFDNRFKSSCLSHGHTQVVLFCLQHDGSCAILRQLGQLHMRKYVGFWPWVQENNSCVHLKRAIHTQICLRRHIWVSLNMLHRLYPGMPVQFSSICLWTWTDKTFWPQKMTTLDKVIYVWLRAGRPGDRGSIPGGGRGFFL
jgi:hypothetical protein